MKFCPNCFQSGYGGVRCHLCGYENKQMTEQRALAPGIWLKNRYMVGRVLGIGGFGITYLVFDSQTRQRWAIKEYFPAEWASRLPGSNQIAVNSQSKDEYYLHGKEVFADEARTLLKFKANPVVVNVIDYFQENGTSYLVMEFLDGATLAQYMKERKAPLPIEIANRMVKEIGDALTLIHGSMMLHRDVSPDNIMLTNHNELKLIDFGATRVYALNSPKNMSVLVKPGFAPLEQYSSSGVQGPWTDVYALAATYYYLVSGKKPPTAPERLTGADLTPLHTLNPLVSKRMEQAIGHALQTEWKKRPDNVQQFIREMGLSQLKVTKQDIHSLRTVHEGEWKKYNQIQKKPQLLLQNGSAVTRYSFASNRLRIGRGADSDIRIANSQISSNHCEVIYEASGYSFKVINYSSNRTFSSKGTLGKNNFVYLGPGEWFYLQTSSDRYIFYVEVQ
ncbi:MAG: FHA domain-containing serine/threonine-protein kinase [Roseburia sp.]|nr:FHA domain-containing serine/threonine-protein kinase [Roseburia sp.]